MPRILTMPTEGLDEISDDSRSIMLRELLSQVASTTEAVSRELGELRTEVRLLQQRLDSQTELKASVAKLEDRVGEHASRMASMGTYIKVGAGTGALVLGGVTSLVFKVFGG